MLRPLEWLCAGIAVLYATLLALATNYDALLFTYENGDLTSTIAVFMGACIGWLGLRLARSRQRPRTGLVIGSACAVGLVAVLWWTTRPTAEVQHNTPTPGTERSWDPPPSDGAPGAVPPPPLPADGP
ncbi:hypothetical protein [Streptomyces sp. NPDC020607]|uniref:hypothetical protein n=1 Tax=Streptomyces sp. NPDC020607 TaxID=3365082 RepID=UPI003791553E